MLPVDDSNSIRSFLGNISLCVMIPKDVPSSKTHFLYDDDK